MGDSKGGNNAPSPSDIAKASGPWLPAQGPLKDILAQLSDYYSNPGNMPDFGPSAVAPFNPITMSGLRSQLGTAAGGIQGLEGVMGRTARGGNMSASDMPGYELYTRMAQGGFDNPATAFFQQIAQDANSGSYGNAGLDTLNKFASGGYLNKNRYSDALLQQGLGDIRENYMEATNPALEGMIGMAGAGGGGSMEALLKGQQMEKLGGELGDFTNNFLSGIYNTDRGMQLQAAGMMPGAYAQNINTRLGAAGGYGGIEQQNLGNQVTGAQGRTALGSEAWGRTMQAGQALPGMFQASMLPGQAITGIGDRFQTQDQAAAQEAQDRYRFEQGAPGDFMNKYMDALLRIGAAGDPAAAAGFIQNEMNQPSGGQMMFGNMMALAGAGLRGAGLYNNWGG